MNTDVPYPYTITQNIGQHFTPNSNNGGCDSERLIESEGQISQSVDQNVVGSGTSEGPLNQIVLSPYYEPNASNSNDATQTVFVSQDHNVYPNSRYSPPPPYDSYQAINPCVQPTQYPQLQLPQQQNVQYFHRLQYPQQESLQYHEGTSYYPQQELIPYPHQRYRNFSDLCKPSIKRNSCNNCFIYCCVYGWFCVLPICILIYLLFYC